MVAQGALALSFVMVEMAGESLDMESAVYYHQGSDFVLLDMLKNQLAYLPDLSDLWPDANIDDAIVGEPGEPDSEEEERLRAFLQNHRMIFLGEGNALPSPARGVVCDLEVGDAKPIYMRSPRIAADLLSKVYELLKRLLETGLIEYSHSEWASVIVLVMKKNGTDVRLCIDYRLVKQLIKLMNYPLPLIDELMSNFTATMWFMTLDMASGFWAVSMTARAQLISAFICPLGHFQLKEAHAKRLVDPEVLECLGISAEDSSDPMGPVLSRSSYIDDIIYEAPSWDDLCKTLNALQYRLRYWNILVSLPKSEFGVKQCKYLGHDIRSDEIRTSPKLAGKVLNLPFPKTQKGVQSFLGSINYYAKCLNLIHEKLMKDPSPQEQSLVECTFLATAQNIPKCSPRSLEGDAFAVTRSKSKQVKATENSVPGTGIDDSGTNDSGANDPGSDDSGTDGPGTKDLGTKDLGTKDLGTNESGTNESENDGPGSNGLGTNGSGTDGLEDEPTADPRSPDCQDSEEDPEDVRRERRRRICSHQADDPGLAPLVKFLQGETEHLSLKQTTHLAKIADQFVLDARDALFYVSRNTPERPRDTADRLRLVIPQYIQEDILHHCHAGFQGAYQGIIRAYERLRKEFYWIGMFKDTERYVKECVDCVTAKGLPRNPGPSPGNLLATRPFQCAFSGFIMRKAMASTEAQDVSEAYEECGFRRFGASEMIRHDRDPRFMGRVFKHFREMLGSRQRATLAYRPQANGQQERSVQTVIRSVKAYVQTVDKSDWDELAEKLMWAVNTSLDFTRLDTPFYQVHG
ncbi:reverse transcriptase [Phytophthora megakarya]|uniref:Reverse transcriptase n=1 Tax=Phytophthora megakarya TaxID=4795 RepID=A0A225VC96_9STRA|nr:reverse transcriptase [Phytophthora megakarya]